MWHFRVPIPQHSEPSRNSSNLVTTLGRISTSACCYKEAGNNLVDVGRILRRGLAGDTTAPCDLLHLKAGDQGLDKGGEALDSIRVAFAGAVPSVQLLDCGHVSFKIVAMAQFEVDLAIRIEDWWKNVGAVQQPACVVRREAWHRR